MPLKSAYVPSKRLHTIRQANFLFLNTRFISLTLETSQKKYVAIRWLRFRFYYEMSIYNDWWMIWVSKCPFIVLDHIFYLVFAQKTILFFIRSSNTYIDITIPKHFDSMSSDEWFYMIVRFPTRLLPILNIWLLEHSAKIVS